MACTFWFLPMLPGSSCWQGAAMKILAILAFHFVRAWALSLVPSGRRRLIAENLVLKQQLLVMNLGKKRSPNLKTVDRMVLGVLVPWLRKSRLDRVSVMWRPETIIRFHQALVKKKYRWLFSNKNPRMKTGPKGPSDELIQIILEMKKRNPRYGYHRIAMQIYQSYGFEVDKHVVRRVLQLYYKPSPPERGQSWLAFLGHTKDSLWSVDFFRCESIRLKTYYVMVVIDQYTRSIIGFCVTQGYPDGNRACRMLNQIVAGQRTPQYLSSDNDPLFKYHR